MNRPGFRRGSDVAPGASPADELGLVETEDGLSEGVVVAVATWQRGSNENTNGLLRQYFPKGASMAGYTQADLDLVAAKLNRRPRETLDFMTPSDVLAEALR